jgi:hypothetical protein
MALLYDVDKQLLAALNSNCHAKHHRQKRHMFLERC